MAMAVQQPPLVAPAGADPDMCWICLEEAAENGSHALMSPCKCPRKVHPQCLARWQLQQAGRHEEKFCRFCNNELADWKHHLTPEELKPEVSKVQPIMVVYFEGQIHRIPVKQGPDGLDEFTGKIRELFRLPEDVDISLTFGCKEPMSGTHLKLEGMGAFDAAVHCASVAAAERQQKMKKSYSTGNLGSVPALSAAAGELGAPAPPGQLMARSASSHHIPVAPQAQPQPQLSASASPFAAAGASAASSAAQARRHRFQGGQQELQAAADAGGGSGSRCGTGRSRSFTSGSGGAGAQRAGSGSLSPEPASFSSILAMLGASSAGRADSPAASARLAPASPQTPAHGRQQQPQALSPQPSPRLGGGGGSQAARMKRERLSLRNITELTDVPEADETLAVGTFTGKMKLTLKAFSRKVARSLSFSSKSPDRLGSSASSGSSSAAAAAAAAGLGGRESPAPYGALGSRSPSPRVAPPALRAASPVAPATPGMA